MAEEFHKINEKIKELVLVPLCGHATYVGTQRFKNRFKMVKRSHLIFNRFPIMIKLEFMVSVHRL